MRLTGAETSGFMRDLSATQHTYPAWIFFRNFRYWSSAANSLATVRT